MTCLVSMLRATLTSSPGTPKVSIGVPLKNKTMLSSPAQTEVESTSIQQSSAATHGQCSHMRRALPLESAGPPNPPSMLAATPKVVSKESSFAATTKAERPGMVQGPSSSKGTMVPAVKSLLPLVKRRRSKLSTKHSRAPPRFRWPQLESNSL